MRTILGIILVGVVVFIGYTYAWSDSELIEESYTANEPGFDPMPTLEELQDIPVGAPGKYTMNELQNWERTPGPLRVGLQVGHLNNQSMPEELENLERNTGAVWGSLTEADVNQVIADLVAEQLRAEGIKVDILEAAVPPGYQADVFASIHADGNTNTDVNGFKFAPPRRDYAGTSYALVDALYESYEAATGLQIDDNITRRMTAYYAFNWPRYEYAIHPFTPAVIIETGFLTSPIDRQIIVGQPERAAAGIAEGLLKFLNTENIEATPRPTKFTTAPQLPLTGEVQCAPLRAERLARADRYDCLPSLTDADGSIFILASYSSSTLPAGTQFTAKGDYMPIHNLGTYFWFPYQINGLIIDPTAPAIDSWFMR